MNRNTYKNQTLLTKTKTGQALVSLIAFIAFGIVVTTAAVTMTIVNSRSSDTYSRGDETLTIAETGADNAILRLLRNPNYVGETLTVGPGTATIVVSGSSTKTIISEGVANDIRRKVQVVGTFANNAFTINSWQEID